MLDEQKNIRVFWEKTDRQEARILRVFAKTPHVLLPAAVEGCPVTELGSYCFAKTPKLPAEYLAADLSGSESAQPPTASVQDTAELCGSYLEALCLPDTLSKIGDYAFYDCRSLTSIQFAGGLSAIGSDAFMNCRSLHQLFIRCGALEKSGLKQILAQIPWDVEVSFLNGRNGTPVQAAVFYPEYHEAYDEIAPAHIFGRKIIGEGFRARQCFKDGVIDYVSYDASFTKACAEETVQTLCRLALCRLRYPLMLSDAKKIQYETYIRAHAGTLCKQLILGRQLDILAFLFAHRLLPAQDIRDAAALAAETGWGEGSAGILRLKQQFYPAQDGPKYDFEPF